MKQETKLTAHDIWATYEYWKHKAALSEDAFPKGLVKEWRKKYKEFSEKQFIPVEDIDEMPKKKFADESIDSPKNM